MYFNSVFKICRGITGQEKGISKTQPLPCTVARCDEYNIGIRVLKFANLADICQPPTCAVRRWFVGAVYDQLWYLQCLACYWVLRPSPRSPASVLIYCSAEPVADKSRGRLTHIVRGQTCPHIIVREAKHRLDKLVFGLRICTAHCRALRYTARGLFGPW